MSVRSYRNAETGCGVDMIASLSDGIRKKGWAVTGSVVPHSTLDIVAASLAERGGDSLRGGMRNLLDRVCIRDLAESVRCVATPVLGGACRAVRGLFFDKRPGSNWFVPWHQDLTIAVRERREVAGFGPWSIKEGVHHVQAPPHLLAGMLAIRIHIDPCGIGNGPLRLIPGSHRAGIFSPAEIERWVAGFEEEIGVAEEGSILAFRPLLLHASSAATQPTHRRVIHLEFAVCDLPGGLEWQWKI